MASTANHISAAPSSSQAAHRRVRPDALAVRFLRRIAHDEFPCVGAKSALSRKRMRTARFASLACTREAQAVHADIESFVAFLGAQPEESTDLHSFAAIFTGPEATDERRFDDLLWGFLQELHAVDRKRGYRWAPDAGSDPDGAHFSMSVAGHPFFVVGLHAGASRLARRFEVPVLVFNSHRQFQRLRASGQYAKMQAAIRTRELALQGSLNPNLADFGSAPETRQYSGRAVEANWRCPLHIRTGDRH